MTAVCQHNQTWGFHVSTTYGLAIITSMWREILFQSTSCPSIRGDQAFHQFWLSHPSLAGVSCPYCRCHLLTTLTGRISRSNATPLSPCHNLERVIWAHVHALHLSSSGAPEAFVLLWNHAAFPGSLKPSPFPSRMKMSTQLHRSQANMSRMSAFRVGVS